MLTILLGGASILSTSLRQGLTDDRMRLLGDAFTGSSTKSFSRKAVIPNFTPRFFFAYSGKVSEKAGVDTRRTFISSISQVSLRKMVARMRRMRRRLFQ